LLEGTDENVHSGQSRQNTDNEWYTMPSDDSAVQPPTPEQSVNVDTQFSGQSESVVPQGQEITDPDVTEESTEAPRYPTRQRRPPSRFKDFVDSQGMS